ncbi:hypothetical protein PT974_09852 [Cladobotryum mycophilum]|uniref:Uncharacterized protein n=1 Tax=Cladobotryum mycophilum TaxID=491253 RepID=A0ABR0SHB7_9HYPO
MKFSTIISLCLAGVGAVQAAPSHGSYLCKLYSGENYQGFLPQTVDKEGCTNLGLLLRNKLGSIEIDPQARCTGYQYTSCTATNIYFNHSEPISPRHDVQSVFCFWD